MVQIADNPVSRIRSNNGANGKGFSAKKIEDEKYAKQIRTTFDWKNEGEIWEIHTPRGNGFARLLLTCDDEGVRELILCDATGKEILNRFGYSLIVSLAKSQKCTSLRTETLNKRVAKAWIRLGMMDCGRNELGEIVLGTSIRYDGVIQT